MCSYLWRVCRPYIACHQIAQRCFYQSEVLSPNYCRLHKNLLTASCQTSYISNSSQWRPQNTTRQFSSTSNKATNPQVHWQNTFITTSRAMEDYLLDSNDLEGLRTRTIRNAHDNSKPSSPHFTTCYLKRDVEKRALEVWGSWTILHRELETRRAEAEEVERRRRGLSAAIALLKKLEKDMSRKEADTEAFGGREERVSFLKGSARVVLFALASNTIVMVLKVFAYLYTGSAAMLSEAIHSLADVLNQLLLAFGISQSIRKPDPSHPYGFSRARYVYSLISGVGIFFLGAGVTVYHGVMGLMHPPTLQFLTAGFAVLVGSLLVEGATLITAIRQVQQSAIESKMSFKEYVKRGRDPSAVAVLMEDSAAVTGVLLASTCLALVHITGNPIYDAIGSISIGGLLGAVALFLIRRNSSALVGRSIPPAQLKQITDLMESDITVRSIHDVKATDLGVDNVRFKAEVYFDGREVARIHVNRLNLENLLKEVHSYTTVTELEKFLLEHGEHVVDQLGIEVDRLEKQIKAQHTEVRHVDLEIL